MRLQVRALAIACGLLWGLGLGGTALLDGAVAGALLAWLYNLAARPS